MLNLKHRKLIFCYLTNFLKKKKTHIKLFSVVCSRGIRGGEDILYRGDREA